MVVRRGRGVVVAEPSSVKVSIIIPALNEAGTIETTLAPLQTWRADGHEIIVVDGGSTDATCTRAAKLVDQLLEAPPGRARQMNAGANASCNELLLFLHADTLLPADAAAVLTAQSRPCWGRFDVRLSGGHFALRVVETLMNWRSRVTGIATGDQAMFVSRALFFAAGGFPDQPLMEDIALSATLRERLRPRCLRAWVVTSSRRWEQHGVFRTIAHMWWLRYRYWRGVDPQILAADYAAVRERA